MKTFLIAIFTLTTTFITAQTTVTWVGGTPGKTTNWNEAKNWSNHRVPDEFSNVLIPDVSATTLASPVIESGKIELNALMLESNALITIHENAQLIVYGFVTSITNENLRINGSLMILDEASESTQNVAASVSRN